MNLQKRVELKRLKLKICSACKEELYYYQFSCNKAHADGKQNECKVCRKKAKKIARAKKREEAKERAKIIAHETNKRIAEEYRQFKKQYKCAHCGCEDHRVLCFHHVDPAIKKYGIRRAFIIGGQTLKEELEKCIPLCHNCHAIIHYDEYSSE